MRCRTLNWRRRTRTNFVSWPMRPRNGPGAPWPARASISREIMKNVRVKLQYGYFHYRDETSGGHNNYDAHTVFSSLLFRF